MGWVSSIWLSLAVLSSFWSLQNSETQGVSLAVNYTDASNCSQQCLGKVVGRIAGGISAVPSYCSVLKKRLLKSTIKLEAYLWTLGICFLAGSKCITRGRSPRFSVKLLYSCSWLWHKKQPWNFPVPFFFAAEVTKFKDWQSPHNPSCSISEVNDHVEVGVIFLGINMLPVEVLCLLRLKYRELKIVTLLSLRPGKLDVNAKKTPQVGLLRTTSLGRICNSNPVNYCVRKAGL